MIPKDFSDFTVVVGDKEYELHKIILQRIPFFKTLFKKKHKDTITLDVNQQAFEKVIRLVYKNILLESDINFGVDEAEVANFLGFNKKSDEKIEKISEDLKKSVDALESHGLKKTKSKLKMFIKPKDLDYYLGYVQEKIDSDYVSIPLIMAVIKDKEMKDFPLVYYHYQALLKYNKKVYDEETDYTSLFNFLFNEERDYVSADEALDTYIDKRLNQLPIYQQRLTSEGMEILRKKVIDRRDNYNFLRGVEEATEYLLETGFLKKRYYGSSHVLDVIMYTGKDYNPRDLFVGRQIDPIIRNSSKWLRDEHVKIALAKALYQDE